MIRAARPRNCPPDASYGQIVVRLSRSVAAGVGVPMEIIRLTPDDPRGSVLLIHGWGESADSLVGLGEHFAAAGYETALVSMRGWGRSGGIDDCGLLQPDDIVAVATELSANQSESGIYLCGISQGGQVALLAAAREPSMFPAVAAWAPVTDVARWHRTTIHPAIADYIDKSCPDGDLRARSPLSVAHRLSMPILLVHGAADDRVPLEQSQLLANTIAANGGHCVLETLPSIGHGGPEARRLAFAATTQFFTTTGR